MSAEAFLGVMGNSSVQMRDAETACAAFAVEASPTSASQPRGNGRRLSPFTAASAESCSSRCGRSWLQAPGAGRSLLLGQAISVLITGTGVLSSFLAADGISLPATQSSLNYVLLSFHLLWDASRIFQQGLAFPWWRFALWALADVEANYLVVMAYRYTSVASVMLLDCFAIPCTMLFSRFALGASYTRGHVAACFVCVIGLGLTVLSDSLSHSSQATPASTTSSQSPLVGDLLVLAGAALYGLSNVQQEQLLKDRCGRCEALGMLGFWGSVVSCIQTAAVEGEEILQMDWSWRVVGLMLGFQLCLFGMYVLTSIFLQFSDATLFNLSLLTSDVYSILFSWQVQHQQISWIYGAAFVTTLSGLVLYHTQPPPVSAQF